VVPSGADKEWAANEDVMTKEIEIKVEEGVQVIRFLRAEKKNALTGPMYDAMSEALDAAEKTDATAVHVFIGSGGVFSAGNDINDFMRRAQAAAAGGAQGIPAPSLDFIRRLPRVTKPMIAAVDGLAIGVGTTMLLHCDLVYATPAASLRTPFLDLGLVQEAGSSITAPARLGYPRAFELICLGDPFSAERALQAGLINAVVPADQLEATAIRAARRLAAKPRQALTIARRLLRRNAAELSAMIEEEAKAYHGLMRSPEAREAFTAFLEKRPPDFAKARQKG
jgi:enoyl-CoA hydratase/carnithine racemase